MANPILPRQQSAAVYLQGRNAGQMTPEFYDGLRRTVQDLQRQQAAIGAQVEDILNILAALGSPDGDSGNIIDVEAALDAKANASITILGTGSIIGGGDLNFNRTFALDGDAFTPVPSSFYGTNPAGVKGFYTFAAGGGGTVTSVNATGSTGLTVGGVPITTSGTITLDLSANLQSWSGILPASKYDTSNPAGYTSNLGTVTSVGLSLPSIITVSGSPVTSSGTLTGTLATQSANLVWAGPTTGSPAAPTFRSLVAADIPSLSGTYQPLDADLTAIAALSTTGGAYRTAANTWALRTLTGTANRVTVTNGDGVAGNPTFDIAATYVGQTSITTLGTVTTGTWNAGTVTATGTAAAMMKAESNSTNATYLELKNTATSGRSYLVFSSGGGPAAAGSFGIFDNVTGATRFSIDSLGVVSIVGNTTFGNGITSVGARNKFAPNNEVFAAFFAYNATRLLNGEGVYVGAKNSATPDMVFSNSGGITLAELAYNGGLTSFGPITSSSPSGGTAVPWKLGSVVTAASALDATRYVQAEINGVAVKLALIT